MDREWRVGQGLDAHRLVPDRPLVLGGVTIPFERGLLGHSDADVLLHALCDALLGAAGQGDIGQHFPDTDPTFGGMDSRILLVRTVAILRQEGWETVNVDATLVCQAPRLAPHMPAMRANIAEDLAISPQRINIKATTTEKMGFTGRGEGIAAMAVVLIERTLA